MPGGRWSSRFRRVGSSWRPGLPAFACASPRRKSLGGSPTPAAAQERALALAQSVEPGSFSSLHDDLVAGRRMELEALHGLVVRRAAQHGVPVPMSEAIYAILTPWALRNEHAGR